jgi:SAM-dependent methyltransferase
LANGVAPGSMAAMTTQAQEFWEQRYGHSDQVWSGRPNARLVEVVEGLPTGSALDLGCGEGGDSLWLAAQGWRVTGVDIAQTALDRASAAAQAAGLTIELQRHDLALDFPTGTFDLVSAQFLQSPIDFPRASVLQAAARAVAPGGLLLIVEHATVPQWSQHQDHELPTVAETLACLELDLSQWTQERFDTPEREITNAEGQTATISDNVIALRRH